jgi:hypothetical protein
MVPEIAVSRFVGILSIPPQYYCEVSLAQEVYEILMHQRQNRQVMKELCNVSANVRTNGK